MWSGRASGSSAWRTGVADSPRGSTRWRVVRLSHGVVAKLRISSTRWMVVPLTVACSASGRVTSRPRRAVQCAAPAALSGPVLQSSSGSAGIRADQTSPRASRSHPRSQSRAALASPDLRPYSLSASGGSGAPYQWIRASVGLNSSVERTAPMPVRAPKSAARSARWVMAPCSRSRAVKRATHAASTVSSVPRSRAVPKWATAPKAPLGSWSTAIQCALSSWWWLQARTTTVRSPCRQTWPARRSCLPSLALGSVSGSVRTISRRVAPRSASGPAVSSVSSSASESRCSAEVSGAAAA